jgi:hypothetical protein
MRNFLYVLLLALATAPLLLSAAESKQPCRILVVGHRQWLNSDFVPFLEAMIEHSHPKWDVRCHVDPGATADDLKVWVGHDLAGMKAYLEARRDRVDGAIKQATPRDPTKMTPAIEERLADLRATRAQWQARLDDLADHPGWDYVLIGGLEPKLQTELVDLALAQKTKTYVLLPFGFEAHGSYYGNAHYMPVKKILPKEVAAARASKAPVVSSAHAFGTLFQTTGELKGPFQFYYAFKFTWMGAYVLACQVHTTLFNVSPVGGWAPADLPESATKPKPAGDLPLKPEYIAQFQEQVWKSHQAFTAALANPAGKEQP